MAPFEEGMKKLARKKTEGRRKGKEKMEKSAGKTRQTFLFNVNDKKKKGNELKIKERRKRKKRLRKK